MGRNRPRKTNRGLWDCNAMDNAIRAVAGGMSIRQASRRFDVPYTTLNERSKSGCFTSPCLGRKATFSKDQEKEIADHVIKLARMFYGLSTMELRKIVFEYAERNQIANTFNRVERTAEKEWVHNFIKRNKNVSLRKPLV